MNTSSSQVHDIKEVSRRSVQLLVIALVLVAVNAIPPILGGYQISSVMTVGFCFYLTGILLLHKKGYTYYNKFLTIVGIDIFLLLITFSEGLQAGTYHYFAALIFAIPYIIDNNKRYNKEVIFYFTLTVVLFSVCIIFCPEVGLWQPLRPGDYPIFYKSNSITAIVMCGAFAYLSIHSERKYAAALLCEKIRAEEAMKARTQFLSHMGHELRTPLNGIIGATNIMNRKSIPEELKEEFGIVKYCSAHMMELINNILDYNKIEAGKLEIHPVAINLKGLLQTATLPFYNRFEEKKVALRVVVDPELNRHILADDIRLIQVINNLVSNALKFTEEGFVELKADCVEQGEEGIRVRFSVQDTGIGIRPEDQYKVFESFGQVYSESTRKYNGTGLGISICQRLLQLMESRLEMTSVPGEGTCFFFSVAFPKTSPGRQQAASAYDSMDLGGIRVLLAEDNLINMLIAKKTMQDWNVQLTTVENGQLALDALAGEEPFDLVLLDLEMPVMDGYSAVREIRRRDQKIPVLAFTASLIDNEMYVALKERGFNDAVLKPFQPMELFSKVRAALRTHEDVTETGLVRQA